MVQSLSRFSPFKRHCNRRAAELKLSSRYLFLVCGWFGAEALNTGRWWRSAQLGLTSPSPWTLPFMLFSFIMWRTSRETWENMDDFPARRRWSTPVLLKCDRSSYKLTVVSCYERATLRGTYNTVTMTTYTHTWSALNRPRYMNHRKDKERR